MENEHRSSTAGKAEPKADRGKVTQLTFKEVSWVIGLLLIPASVMGWYWIASHNEATVVNRYSGPVVSIPGPGTFIPAAVQSREKSTLPERGSDPQNLHADLYFDFGSSRLRADAIAVLQEQVKTIANDGSKEDWAVLIQGYTDQHGPAAYNRQLGLRRAQATKQFLIESGIPEASVKVVALGKDSVLCGNDSKQCGRLNRRVHVELVKVGKAALIAVPKPVLVTQPQPSSMTEEPAIDSDSVGRDETESEILEEAQDNESSEESSQPAIDAQ